MPPIQAFNPAELSDLWGKCFQVSTQRSLHSKDYKYDYIGSELYEIFGSELVGKKVSTQLQFLPAKKMIDMMEKNVLHPEPYVLEGKFIDHTSHLVKYRCCMLPFGSDKKTVSHFIVGLSWSKF